MHPENTPDAHARDIAFIAYRSYKETTQILAEKFGDDYTANEEIFALMACMVQCAVFCEIPVEHLISNLKMMYTARCAAHQIDAEEAANDNTH